MARTKRKRVASPSHARPRPLWFDGLSPQDLNHVLSLIDMGMDSERTSRSQEVSSECLAAYPNEVFRLGADQGVFANNRMKDIHPRQTSSLLALPLLSPDLSKHNSRPL